MEPLRSPLLKRLRRAHWAALDGAVAVLMVPVSTTLASGLGGPPGPAGAGAAVVVPAVLVAAFRRYLPPSLLALVVVVGPLAVGISTFPAPWLAVAFVMYLVPRRFPGRDALLLLAGSLVATAVGLSGVVRLPGLAVAPYARPGPNRVGLLLVCALLFAVAWTIGYAMQQQRLYTAGLRLRAEQEAREQVADARRALDEDRLRIARELHDVVAHTMSVIAVQAGVANHVAVEHPEEARRALSSIEETSRGALREMRAMLGVLRDEESGSAVAPAPAPGLEDLGALVRRAAAAGVQVRVDVIGERVGLTAGQELAAYRVVQEAVTNVIKHAAIDRCRVSVIYRPEVVTVEVVDEGKGTRGSAPGHGIAGMRERVGMYGGEFRAGPLPGRGFRVTATFPLANPVAS